MDLCLWTAGDAGWPITASLACMDGCQDVITAIAASAGVSDAGTLIRLSSRSSVAAAVECGQIVRDARGRYALPTAESALRAANRLSAVVSHTSAAAYWGWEMKEAPELPTVTVPRKRKVPVAVRTDVRVFWRTLGPGQCGPGQVTAPLQTVLDCARWLPFDEGLAIADSALRRRSLTARELSAAARTVAGRGRPAVLRVLGAADARAANPFESVLRAISLDVPGLHLTPQVTITLRGRRTVRPDLVDERLRIVAEADSFEHHGSREALVRDCARYDNLVADGWAVLRFSWEQVMSRPGWIRSCLAAATDRLIHAHGGIAGL